MILSTSTDQVEEQNEFDRLWNQLQTTLSSQREVSAPKVSIRPFPAHLMFGEGGNAGDYQIFGWNHPEQGFTWTEGAEALIELPTPETPGDYFLNAYVAPFLTDKNSSQRVTVKVGEVGVAGWDVQAAGHYFALIPAHLLERTQELSFHFTHSKSPSDLGLSDDNREIALRFFQLWLTPWRSLHF